MGIKLTYDPETGALYRKGKRAGHAHSSGYRRVRVGGKPVEEHRVAWYLTHGYWPQHIDHINGDRADNRLENLREVTHRENHTNRSVHREGKLRGTTWLQGKWVAQAYFAGERYYLGRYTNPKRASQIACSVDDYVAMSAAI